MVNLHQFEQQVADEVRASSMGPRDAGPARRLDVHRARLADEKLPAGPGTVVRSRTGCVGLLHLYLTSLAVRLPHFSPGRRHAAAWRAARDAKA